MTDPGTQAATTQTAIEQWHEAQVRVTALLAGATPEQVETPVPATPAWTARQLLSHMVGLDADTVAGDEPNDHNPTWTQAQVDARAADDVGTILIEWAGLTGRVTEYMATTSTRPLGDVVIHEQDLRGALDAPGAQDNPGLLMIRERMAGAFTQAVERAGLAQIELAGPGFTLRAGAPGDTDEPDVRLEAADFDLLRALLSRRSAAQLRSWAVVGDVGPYLDCFTTLGPLPERDLAI